MENKIKKIVDWFWWGMFSGWAIGFAMGALFTATVIISYLPY